MAVSSEINLKCGKCGHVSPATVYSSIDAVHDSDLKDKVRSGDIFVHECPLCGHRELVTAPLLYHDPEAKYIVCLSDRSLNVEGLEGYTGRRVTDVGSFIEKVKIFDDGLDDIAIEVCKYVTRQELGKDVDLKYLKLDGADNEIAFTYPEKGEMQMVAVGFNVYEDSCGIVSRNPVFREKASGLVVIDAVWLSDILV